MDKFDHIAVIKKELETTQKALKDAIKILDDIGEFPRVPHVCHPDELWYAEDANGNAISNQPRCPECSDGGQY